MRRYKKFDHFFANFILNFRFFFAKKQKYRKKIFKIDQTYLTLLEKGLIFKKEKFKKLKNHNAFKKKCEFEHFF